MPQWEKTYETSVGYRAQMVRTLLESNNIPAVILNKQDSSYLFGHFEIFVPADYVIKALIVLEQSDLE
jgi:Putative prokaryotic signal transducing protein